MAGGYRPGTGDQYDSLVEELRRIARRLAELETPTGTSVTSLVEQVRVALADITTTVTNAITSLSYTQAQIDTAIATSAATRVAKAGDTMTGDLLLPNATAAASGYVVAYINVDGRVSKGASSSRFKKFISTVIPTTLGDLFAAPFRRFQMRQGDGTWRYGYIAEELVGTPMEPFVVWEEEDGTPVPVSIDFVGMLLAQNAQLNERLRALEG